MPKRTKRGKSVTLDYVIKRSRTFKKYTALMAEQAAASNAFLDDFAAVLKERKAKS